MPEPVRWALMATPSILLLNWVVVLLATASVTLRRRGEVRPPWREVSRLAAGIALHPRMRVRTLWLATQLLVIDCLAPIALLLVGWVG